MKTKRIVCLLSAATLGFGSLSAFAQGHDDRHEQDRGDQHHSQRAMGNHGHEADRHERQDTYYYGARGPEWHRGGRVPAQYRDRQYVVDDWRGHHLSAPPRGYHWVQVGNDYVLAAIATGVIAQLLLNHG